MTSAFSRRPAASSSPTSGAAGSTLLEVVQHQQQLLVPQVVPDDLAQRPAAGLPHVQRAGDGRGDEVRIARRRERLQGHEADAVLEVVEQVGRHGEGQARLAHPAGAGQRQQARLGPQQEAPDRRHLALPADERRRLLREAVPNAVRRSRRPGIDRERRVVRSHAEGDGAAGP